MKYIVYGLFLVMAILVFTQWQSCNANKRLQSDLDSSEVLNTELKLRTVDAKMVNDSINVVILHKDDSFSRVSDSLTEEIKSAKKTNKTLSQQTNDLFNTLLNYANTDGDTTLQRKADSLKNVVEDYRASNGLIDSLYAQKDSTFESQIRFKDTVISVKNSVIDSLMSINQKQETLITSLQNNIKNAIRSGKRTNILRSIGEALLVIALIFKK